jgi:hypothetical protein
LPFASTPLAWILGCLLSLGIASQPSLAKADAGLCRADVDEAESSAERMIAAEGGAAESSAKEEVFDFSAFFLDELAPRSSSKKLKKKTEAGSSSAGCRECSSPQTTQKLTDNVRDLQNTLPVTKRRARAKRILPEPAPEPKYTTANPDEETWKQFPDIYKYSSSNEVKKSITYALHPPGGLSARSTGYCYASVKNALFKGGKLTKHRLIGDPVFPEIRSKARKRFGQNAIKNLLDQGFINLMEDPRTKALIKDPASAPKGAVLIYKGGHKGGHIEIKTDFGARGSYVSDFKNSHSVLGNELAGRTSAHYQLVAVMVKSPMEPGE